MTLNLEIFTRFQTLKSYLLCFIFLSPGGILLAMIEGIGILMTRMSADQFRPGMVRWVVGGDIFQKTVKQLAKFTVLFVIVHAGIHWRPVVVTDWATQMKLVTEGVLNIFQLFHAPTYC